MGIIIYAKKSNNANLDEQVSTRDKINNPMNPTKTEDGSIIDSQNLPSGTPPKWAQRLMDINDNPVYSREDKIKNLVELLKQNEFNPQAVSGILISLTALNPIEAADDIIPYLKSSDPNVQSTALGALNNASLLTEKEHELKLPLPENEAVRKRISEAVNELKSNPDTSAEVRQALISTYSATNPSLQDTRAMNNEILSQSRITPNEASYLATSVLNGKELSTVLTALNNKDTIVRDTVISSIGASIAENSSIVSTLTQHQREQLSNFIHNNPPKSSDENFIYLNDQWKHTLNILDSNI